MVRWAMRRLRIALAAGALVIAGALAAAWIARAPQDRAPSPVPAPESQNGGAREPAKKAEAPAPFQSAPESATPPRSPIAAPRGGADSRADAELIALEDNALRRIDVVALLDAAGIDPRELQRRPDADDVLRHLAGDELLVRLYMRLQFGLRVYPPDQPREAALRDARAKAEDVVAGLSAAERARYLADALAVPEGPPPEPLYPATH